MIDIHCHIIPGVDDGVQTLDSALELIAREVEGGTRAFIATSHVNSIQELERVPLLIEKLAEVQAALEAQRRARYGKIGEWIEKLGFATEKEVTTALALQWGCPVASSFDPSVTPEAGSKRR